MRVVCVFGPSRVTGASLTARGFMRQLASRGHVVWDSTIDNDDHWDAADVALVHLDDPDKVAAMAGRHRTPVAALVRRPGELSRVGRVALAVFATEAARKSTVWTGRSVVVRPWIPVGDYHVPREERRPGMVTTVGLGSDRSPGVAYRMASRLRDHKFLMVPTEAGTQHGPHAYGAAPANLTVWDTMDGSPANAKRFYGRTRVLLQPGVTTYGRSAVEAMCSGIPVVAHPCPAAREVLGDAAVWCRNERPGDWVDAVRRLDDPLMWRTRSLASFERAVALDPEAPMVALEVALGELSSLRSEAA